MTAVRRCRKSYGLSTGDVLVLDTLLSFLPCRDRATGIDRPISADMVLVVYASNRTICSRANEMDDRVLRRHIANLRRAGMIDRKDSATGKRFPLRRGGRVTDAYGIDLLPLLHLYPELAAEAERIAAEAEEIRTLRAEALSIRAEILRSSDGLGDEIRSFVEGVKTILRRANLSVARIAELIQDMRRIALGQPAAEVTSCGEQSAYPATPPNRHKETGSPVRCTTETAEESARNGRNVRQVDPMQIDSYKTGTDNHRDLLRVWDACPNIASLCPDALQSPSRLRETVFMIGSFFGLKIECLADGVSRVGWVRVLQALEYLAENVDRIRSPGGYFRTMIEQTRPADGSRTRLGGGFQPHETA